MSSEKINAPQDTKQRVKIGVIYNLNGLDNPNSDELRRMYATYFGDPKEKLKLEKLNNCEYVPIDYNDPELLDDEGKDRTTMAQKRKWLEEKLVKEGISAAIIPGNPDNIISPGQQDLPARAEMEEALIATAKKLGMPLLGICGGEQRWIFTKIKGAIKQEILQEVGPNASKEQIHQAFKLTFEGVFSTRCTQLKELVVSKFEEDRKNNPGVIFDKKYVENMLADLNSYKNKYYINQYFSDFFVQYLDFIDSHLKDGKFTHKDAFFDIFSKHDDGYFKEYFYKTTPLKDNVSASLKGFDVIFEKYFKKYGEVNGIILINNARLLTGHNHCPEDGHRHIDTKSPMIVVRDDKNPFNQALPAHLKTPFPAEISGASEHNQAVRINSFNERYLRYAGVTIGATDQPNPLIIKGAYSIDDDVIAIQNHPEATSFFLEEDLKKCTNDFDRQKLLDGDEYARNLTKLFMDKARAVDLGKVAERANDNTPVNDRIKEALQRPQNRPWVVSSVTSAQVVSALGA